MFIYIFILFLLFVLGVLEIGGRLNGSQVRTAFLIVITFFGILSFIRWKTGTDWDAYYDFFQSNKTLYEFQNRLFEPFYTYIAYFVKTYTDKYWILLLVYSSIIYALVSPTILKYSPLPFISLILYFLLRKADIFFTRESIALAFCLFSIRYIEKRKLISFLLIIIIGIQFHKSVVVFLPAYFIYNIHFSIRKILTIVAVVFTFSIVSAEWIQGNLLKISFLLGDAFFNKTEAYLERGDETFGYGLSLQRNMIQGLINNGLFLLIFAYTVKKYNTKFVQGLFNLYAFSIILFFITIPLNLTLVRVFNSYNLMSIILIGYSFKCFNKDKVISYYLLFFIYICVRFSMQTFFGGYSYCFVPFRTILW